MPTMPETDETLTYVTCQRVAHYSQQYKIGLDTYNVPLLLFDHLGKESLQCPEVCKRVHGERPERHQHEERLVKSTDTHCWISSGLKSNNAFPCTTPALLTSIVGCPSCPLGQFNAHRRARSETCLVYDLLSHAFDLLPLGNVTLVVCDIVCLTSAYSHDFMTTMKSSQFSVTIGLTSKTTTVTLRTARVFATSSPIPEEPPVITTSWSPQSRRGGPKSKLP